MQMVLHYGTKAIKAEPMTRAAYNDYRGWELPADENGSDVGFLVEYLDSPNSNHPDHKGYISWSPEGVFNDAYKTSGSMSFGHALEALKAGLRVARKGWNGKGMWLSLSGSTVESQTVKEENFWSDHTAKFACENGGAATVLPCIVMKTADDKILMGWLASQSDMLAEDWEIL